MKEHSNLHDHLTAILQYMAARGESCEADLMSDFKMSFSSVLALHQQLRNEGYIERSGRTPGHWHFVTIKGQLFLADGAYVTRRKQERRARVYEVTKVVANIFNAIAVLWLMWLSID